MWCIVQFLKYVFKLYVASIIQDRLGQMIFKTASWTPTP